MSFDEDLPKKPRTHEIGANLSTYSVYELEEYLRALEEEKSRVTAMIERKNASRNAADSVFKS
jgi:uncharacterized small protein (DUF1192 family)